MIQTPPKHPWAADAAKMRATGVHWSVIGQQFGVNEDVARGVVRRWAAGTPTQAERPLVAQAIAGENPAPAVRGRWQQTKPQVKFRAPEAQAPKSQPPPAVHTSRTHAENYLVISDAQLPYHHPGALAFCEAVRRNYGVPLENVLCVGDEFDLYFASRFEKSPDAPHTPKQELEAAREEVARWVAAFPRMRICYSNHGGRLRAAAHRANLPIQLIRNVKEIFGLPEEWRYAEHWIIHASKQAFRVEHGHVGPGGHSGLRGRPLNRQIATAWGHEHSEPGTIHIDTHGPNPLWGMRVGSLINPSAPAFEYNAEDASRPVRSVGVVLDGGRLPHVVRM